MSAAWNTNPTNPNLVARDQAEQICNDLARSKGIKGSYKVFYNNNIIEDPSGLPEMFDKTLIKVSATLDQA